jgi:hypothetical protein
MGIERLHGLGLHIGERNMGVVSGRWRVAPMLLHDCRHLEAQILWKEEARGSTNLWKETSACKQMDQREECIYATAFTCRKSSAATAAAAGSSSNCWQVQRAGHTCEGYNNGVAIVTILAAGLQADVLSRKAVPSINDSCKTAPLSMQVSSFAFLQADGHQNWRSTGHGGGSMTYSTAGI